MNISLDKPAGVLIKTTLVDFPETLAGSFFLRGCNLRCPYCYNKGLLNNSDSSISYSTINDLFTHLEKRQGILKGLVISGGEPLLNPYTPIIIKKAKSLGYKIKLDTNGTLPDELEYFVKDEELKPDFIAMDIKTSPEKYSKFLCSTSSLYYDNSLHFETVLKKSIEIISQYPSNQREFRTVLVPKLVEKEDISIISKIIPKDSQWRFAQFINSNCLNQEFETLTPYTQAELDILINEAKKYISDSKIR